MQDKYHVEHLKQVLKTDEVNPATLLKEPMPKLEEEWCSFHYLLQSSLHQVSEICMYHKIGVCFMVSPLNFLTPKF